MTTASTAPPTEMAGIANKASVEAQEISAGGEHALVAVPGPITPAANISPDGPVSRLPVEVEVGVALRDFRVRNLLSLDPGVVVESQWGHGDDVPISAGKVQLAWAEFEVMDLQLAVRVTRLA